VSEKMSNMLRSSDAQVRSYARRLFLQDSILKSATSRTSLSADHPVIVSQNEVRSKYAQLLISQRRFVSSSPTTSFFWVTVDFWGWQVSLESPSIVVRRSRLVKLLRSLRFILRLYLGPLTIRAHLALISSDSPNWSKERTLTLKIPRSRSSEQKLNYDG
jgi:hypothetical protein